MTVYPLHKVFVFCTSSRLFTLKFYWNHVVFNWRNLISTQHNPQVVIARLEYNWYYICKTRLIIFQHDIATCNLKIFPQIIRKCSNKNVTWHHRQIFIAVIITPNSWFPCNFLYDLFIIIYHSYDKEITPFHKLYFSHFHVSIARKAIKVLANNVIVFRGL